MTAEAKESAQQWPGCAGPEQAVPDHSGPKLAARGGIDIIECAVCGFAHVLPLPDPAALARFYREEFYDSERPQYLELAGQDEAWLRLNYADRFQVFEEYLPAERRKILDVGSGPGFFLAEAKAQGWQGLGVEPSQTAADHARSLGLTVINDFFDESLTEHLDKFDVVHMGEVLEHVPNPADILALARDQLAPDGLICLSVPNDFNDLQAALTEHYAIDPWWVMPKHHLNYFSFDSLERLVAKAGFELLARDTSFPMEMFLLMGENYVGNKPLGRQLHTLRKKFDHGLARHRDNTTRRRFYRALAGAGFGRTAIITAKCPL